MAVTHPSAVRTGVADFIVDQLDTGTPDANADLEIQTGATAALVVIALSATAFGAANGTGVASLAGTPSGTATATGTAAKFIMRNKANVTKIQGAVGATGSDINLSSTSINSGDKVTITSLTYAAMP